MLYGRVAPLYEKADKLAREFGALLEVLEREMNTVNPGDDQVDMLGKNCLDCGAGTYEAFRNARWPVVECPACRHRLQQWESLGQLLMYPRGPALVESVIDERLASDPDLAERLADPSTSTPDYDEANFERLRQFIAKRRQGETREPRAALSPKDARGS